MKLPTSEKKVRVEEGFTQVTVISAVESARLHNDQEVSDNIDELSPTITKVLILNLVLLPDKSPFEVTANIWGFYPNGQSVGSLWKIENIYNSFSVLGNSSDGYTTYNPRDLEGKKAYAILFKNQNGYLSSFDFFAKDEKGFSYVESQFKKQIDAGRLKLSDDSIFNKKAKATETGSDNPF